MVLEGGITKLLSAVKGPKAKSRVEGFRVLEQVGS